jgi:hypothetical protein
MHGNGPCLLHDTALGQLRQPVSIERQTQMRDDHGFEEHESDGHIEQPTQGDACLAAFRAKNDQTVFADLTDIALCQSGALATDGLEARVEFLKSVTHVEVSRYHDPHRDGKCLGLNHGNFKANPLHRLIFDAFSRYFGQG